MSDSGGGFSGYILTSPASDRWLAVIGILWIAFFSEVIYAFFMRVFFWDHPVPWSIVVTIVFTASVAYSAWLLFKRKYA